MRHTRFFQPQQPRRSLGRVVVQPPAVVTGTWKADGANRLLRLVRVDGSTAATTLTDSKGGYRFEVAPGPYRIEADRDEGLHTAAALVDMLALLVSSAIASSRPVARWRALAIGGVPIAAAILLLGYATVQAEPDLSGLLAEGAPVQAWLLSLLAVSAVLLAIAGGSIIWRGIARPLARISRRFTRFTEPIRSSASTPACNRSRMGRIAPT